MLVFRYPETSQNLSSFINLLFSLFQRGIPFKKSKKPRNLPKLPRPVAKMIWSFWDLWNLIMLPMTNNILFKGYWNSKFILILIVHTEKGYENHPWNGSLDNLLSLFSPYNDNGNMFWILVTLANPCNHCAKPSFSSLGDGEHVGMQMYQRKC